MRVAFRHIGDQLAGEPFKQAGDEKQHYRPDDDLAGVAPGVGKRGYSAVATGEGNAAADHQPGTAAQDDGQQFGGAVDEQPGRKVGPKAAAGKQGDESTQGGAIPEQQQDDRDAESESQRER